jgi:hypothetical protein
VKIVPNPFWKISPVMLLLLLVSPYPMNWGAGPAWSFATGTDRADVSGQVIDIGRTQLLPGGRRAVRIDRRRSW